MILGVIGGLGPMATARFMEMVIRMTDASCDQEHLEMIIHNCPQIPDRTAYILGESDRDPVPSMIAAGRNLAVQGASCIAVPCITAHYFHRELSEGIGIPIINAITETGRELIRSGAHRIGIMATDGTVRSGIFQKELEEMGLEVVLPDEAHQKYIMDVIYKNIKSGQPADLERFDAARRNLKEQGAQILILGCTELSLIDKEQLPGEGYLDAMEVLARSAVTACRGRLKSNYEDLIR